ncbi:MAG: hypothetical protein CHACPFDD_04075 [Phycisphaerae bacterium]|nr:hypothetical protein [Phycisphaerae bacterium]
MKKWIILFGGIGLVLAGWYFVRSNPAFRVTPEWNMPKFAKVTRGDVRVPITATGIIQPDARIEVKSEATGEVEEIRVVEGDFVKAGDVLAKLERDTEERNFARAEADLELARAALDIANVKVDDAAQAVEAAISQLDSLVAEFPVVEMEHKQVLEDAATQIYSSVDSVRRKWNLDRNLASQRGAVASIKQRRNDVETAKLSVKQQEQTLAKADATYKDAQKRLSETTIVATTDALVTEVRIRKGEKVQSAFGTVTGGTTLLTLADISKVIVVAAIDEADYGRIVAISPVNALPATEYREQVAREEAEKLEKRTGKVKLLVDAFPDDEFEGMIERVEPQGKQNVGASVIQFNVHVVITDERRAKLPLGAQAQVEFTVQSAKNVLVVPSDAVKSYLDQTGVWVSTPPAQGQIKKGKRFVPCRIGISDGENTELIAPLGDEKLAEGTEVYTKIPRETDER